MSGKLDLKRAIRYVSLAYVLLTFQFKLGSVDSLPDWLGYFLIFQALPALEHRERTMGLLRPLAGLMAAATLCTWIFQLLGQDFYFPAAELLVSMVSLYFHFQLLTDLARIAQAAHFPQSDHLLHLRTAMTVIPTVNQLLPEGLRITVVMAAIILCLVAVIFWLCATLLQLSQWIDKQ